MKNYNKYVLGKIDKRIRTKEIIYEAPIGYGKLAAIRRWISAHKDDKFKVIAPNVNIAEEFYTKLTPWFDNNSIRLCVENNAFKEFGKAANNEVNIVITTHSILIFRWFNRRISWYRATNQLFSRNRWSSFIIKPY